ncbi:MAG: sigma-70 family RNA polymerase sigma factor [Sterolibacterium sp.]
MRRTKNRVAGELYKSHERWAMEIGFRMARRYAPLLQRMNRGQVRQAVRVGLWDACLKYDAKVGEFKPFAYKRIRGQVQDEFHSLNWWDVRTKRGNPVRMELEIEKDRVDERQPKTVTDHEDKKSKPQDAQVIACDYIRQLLKFVSKPLCKKILRMRYWRNLSHRQIGDKFGLSVSRVSQIEREALDEMRIGAAGLK